MKQRQAKEECLTIIEWVDHHGFPHAFRSNDKKATEKVLDRLYLDLMSGEIRNFTVKQEPVTYRPEEVK